MSEAPAGYDPDGEPVPWRAFLHEAEQRFAEAGFDDPRTDARRIVEEASGFEGPEFHSGLDEFATVRGVTTFDRMIDRRLSGEPLQYVVGRWGFRTLDLMVDPRALIPRPETEVVAGIAIDELARQAAATSRLIAVDLGTGSGAIGLSVAVEGPDVEVLLTDVSPDALSVARANLAGIGPAATRVSIFQGEWFAALPPKLRGEVAVIVSNPPYVARSDDLPAVVADWEPHRALVAGERGTEDLEHLIDVAGQWLRARGALVLEMAPHQTDAMAERARRVGFVDVDIAPDLAGRPRALRARWPG